MTALVTAAPLRAVVCGILLTALPGVARAQGLEGEWSVAGTSSKHGAYTGTVTLAKAGAGHTLSATVTHAAGTAGGWTGTGSLAGAKVVFTGRVKKGLTGALGGATADTWTGTYTLSAAGDVLEGDWKTGSGTTGKEKLTRPKPAASAGLLVLHDVDGRAARSITLAADVDCLPFDLTPPKDAPQGATIALSWGPHLAVWRTETREPGTRLAAGEKLPAKATRLWVEGRGTTSQPETLAAVYDANGAKLQDSGEVRVERLRFYEDNPTYVDPVDDTASWEFATPASQGMDAAKLEAAAADMKKRKYAWSLIVIRHDKIVLERYWNGSHARASNNVHSASKSILSAAVGIAIEKGLIAGPQQKISELLPGKYRDVGAAKQLTLRHLLTMTGGLRWVEDETETEIEKTADWTRSMLLLPRVSPPGTAFKYSTAMTHLESVILGHVTGSPARTFVEKNLLSKIGVTPEHWGRDPQRNASGGFNLYLTARELAKFGLLYLHEGAWKGEQVVPKQWVKDSIREQVQDEDGDPYGYNWWLGELRGHRVAIAWGFGGQMLYLVPDLDLLVVMTTNTRDSSPDFKGEELVRDLVIPSVQH